MRHFDDNEFECNCGCKGNQMDYTFTRKLDRAREISGVPYVITSGYRCEKYNKDVGGKPDSSHPKGLAADIYTDGSRWRFKILDGLIRAGFTRIGIADDFIHADDDKDKDPEVAWVY